MTFARANSYANSINMLKLRRRPAWFLTGALYWAMLVGGSMLRPASASGTGENGIGSAHGNADEGAISQTDYLLQPYDLIHVVIFQEPDLERQVRLSDASNVTLPLIGPVNLKGRTIGAAQQQIRDLYNSHYLVNPQVNVTVIEYAKETVNVLGSVNSPGSIVIPPDQPLYIVDAITRAGGFTRLADRKKVKVTVAVSEGRASTIIVNVDDIIQSHTSDPIKLHKGDVVFVPERIL